MDAKITFIGAGNMASSIIGGLIASGTAPESIIVSDANPDQLSKVATRFSVNTDSDNARAVSSADIIVLAIKPHIVAPVCHEIGSALQHQPLVVSIAAGIREGDIARWLNKNLPVVRCMPNTPALLNCGASALHGNSVCNSVHQQQAETLLNAVGTTVWVEQEAQIDTVTALSGSGPAYFFHLIECMTDAATAMGLPASVAETLAIETAFGAASMARSRQASPARLRENVTSKGGTTAAALASFSQDDFAAVVQRAMEAARLRAESLAEELGSQ